MNRLLEYRCEVDGGHRFATLDGVEVGSPTLWCPFCTEGDSPARLVAKLDVSIFRMLVLPTPRPRPPATSTPSSSAPPTTDGGAA